MDDKALIVSCKFLFDDFGKFNEISFLLETQKYEVVRLGCIGYSICHAIVTDKCWKIN